VLNIQFTQTDADGNEVEGGISKENSVILKYFTPAVAAQLQGKKVGDSIVAKLSDSFEGDKLHALQHDLGLGHDAAGDQFFKLVIVKIGLVEKRAMDETFYGEVFPGAAIATEEEFKNKLKEEIDQYWLAQSRNQLHDQLYHFLLDETNMEFPASFLKRWLQTGGEKPKTADEAEAEFPMFSQQLKWTLISDKIIKDNQLEVGAEELKESMKAEIMRYFGAMSLGEDQSWLDSYVERMMKDEKHVDTTYRRLVTEKLFNWAESKVNPAEKEVSAEALNAMQHNHQH
jgi:trigger factor